MIHDPLIIKNDLLQLDSSVFATKWYFDTRPFVFENSEEDYLLWRHMLSAEIDIDPSDLLITGSACLGISFNPYKNFKSFDQNSDIDICIFSEYYFTVAWRELLNQSMVGLKSSVQNAIKKHRETYIYWGTIATDIILPVLSFGPKWARIIPKISIIKELEGHEIHFRIYKDRQAFRRYLLQTLSNRKTALMEDKNSERLFEQHHTEYSMV